MHCTSLTLPADIQRRIFNLTNRAILKASKYLSLLEHQKKIKLNELTINQKFNIIGIDEFTVTQLINNINTFNSGPMVSSGDKHFSSAYIVEGVEIILSILSVIKESFHSLDQYLKDTFDYSLPVWIEAIIKLGQFLNFFQGTSSLEGILMKEIYDQLNINSQFEKLLIIKNIPAAIDNTVILSELKKILTSSKARVVDFEKDVQIFIEDKDTKCACVLIDGFSIDILKDQQAEEIKPEIVEEPFWECSYCHMENDKDNSFCIFCDKNKKAKVKEAPKKNKSSLIKIDSYLYTANEKMQNLKSSIKNSQILSEIELKSEIIEEILLNPNNGENNEAIESEISKTENKIIPAVPIKRSCIKVDLIKNDLSIYQGEESKNNKNLFNNLNWFFFIRFSEYVKEKDYLSEKLRDLENNKAIRKYIANEIDILKNLSEKITRDSTMSHDENINFIKIYEILQNSGVDFWLESVVLDPQSRNNEINIKLLEKIREVVDLKICKEKDLSLILPALDLRFVPSNFNSINHNSVALFDGYYKDVREVPLSVIRYYWTIIKYFNNCLVAALPFIKPPDAYSKQAETPTEEGYINIPFPKTMSAFLSSARGITFSITKQNLIKEIISYTEFNEEEVQIPTFKFERLSILNNVDKNSVKIKNKKNAIDNNSMFLKNDAVVVEELKIKKRGARIKKRRINVFTSL